MFDGCPALNVEQPLQSPHNPSSSWLHTPPAQMPWSLPIADQPTVMRFTGDSSSSSFGLIPGMKSLNPEMQTPQKCQSKRKSWDCEIEYSPPAKQLITEEKMAENLNCLHISNSYVSHQIGSSQPMSIPLPESSRTSESAASSSESSSSSIIDTIDGKDRTVSLCEQLRKLISESSVIASPIINKVERPSNALVLWQPPGGSILKNMVTTVSKEEEKKKEDFESKPSTSGLNFSIPSTSRGRWDDLMDNNNSTNAMDLNLCSSPSSISQRLPSEVPLPDDDFMDLPEDSMMDL